MIKNIRTIGMSVLAAGLRLLAVSRQWRARRTRCSSTTTGNVGIGTSTHRPSASTSEQRTGGNTAGRIQNSSATGYSGFEYLNNLGNPVAFLGTDNANANTRFNSFNNYPIVILTNSVERMRVTSAGNVGIGTTNPGAKLEVSGGEVRFPAGRASEVLRTSTTLATGRTTSGESPFLQTMGDWSESARRRLPLCFT